MYDLTAKNMEYIEKQFKVNLYEFNIEDIYHKIDQSYASDYEVQIY